LRDGQVAAILADMRRLAVPLATCVAVLAAAAPAANAGVAGKRVAEDPSAVRAYWTPARMANAVPVGLERGAPAHPRVKGGHGGGGGSTTPTWSSGAVDLSEPLARTNGKVFFTEGGVNYVCSGTAIDSDSDVVAWTAGHCVNDGNGTFATNWTFVVGYRTASEQKFPASALFTTTSWAAPGGDEFGEDFGAGRLATDSNTLTAAVGGSLRQYSFSGALPLNAKVTAYGYPAAGKFKGTTLWKCASFVDLLDQNSDPAAMGIPCDMTGGSSGGGWIDSNGRLVSVNSYGYPGLKYMFGPQPGASASSVLAAADGAGGDAVVGN